MEPGHVWAARPCKQPLAVALLAPYWCTYGIEFDIKGGIMNQSVMCARMVSQWSLLCAVQARAWGPMA